VVVRRISLAERRARLAQRHRLTVAERTDDPPAIARSLVVLHASDPASVVLSVLARMARPATAPIEAALYEDRSLVRMLAMRRTLFAVDRELLPIVHASSSLAVAANERKKLVKALTEAGTAGGSPGRWLAELEATTLAALRELGSARAQQLTKAVPELGTQLVMNASTNWPATVGMSSRVLLLLAADGHIIRGRTNGGWTSGTHQWVPVEQWLDGPIPALDVEVARAELVRRWLGQFGPGSEADVAWWTGWTLGATRAALRSLDLEAVEMETGDGSFVPAWVLAGDDAPTGKVRPWEALLPSLDPTVMGWQERSWYLGPHKADLFDRNGNAGPTIWMDGHIVGGWAQRKDDGRVVTRLLESVPAARARRIEALAAGLQGVLGPVRVTPRFPTPVDRELRA
jgi:hypothetical protein